MGGHSIKQIADNMGISIPAAKSRLARARVALRKSMVTAPGRAAAGAELTGGALFWHCKCMSLDVSRNFDERHRRPKCSIGSH